MNEKNTYELFHMMLQRRLQKEVEELNRSTTMVFRVVANVRQRLENMDYSSINSLGELQRLSQDFDRQCSIVHEVQRMIETHEECKEEFDAGPNTCN